MGDNRQSLSDMLNTRETLAEKADHPWRQVKQSFGAGEAERWTVQQVQFSEDARMAARRALWFLRLVEVDSEEPLCQHARVNALGQLRNVRVPTGDELCQPGDDDTKCKYSGAIEPKFATLAATWGMLLEELAPTKECTPESLRLVEKGLAKFIRRSRPLDPFIRFTYSFVPAMRHFGVQHFALFATFFIGLGVCAGVEAVRSILMNEPRFTGIAVLAALLPLSILYIAQRALIARGRSPWWNLGGRVVHALPVSVEPERWIEWHPPGYAQKIYMSLLVKLVLHVALWVVLGWVLAASIRVFGGDGVWLTVYLIVMLWALVVLLGGVLDFADIHSPSPLRGMMAGGVVVVSLAIVWTDSEPAAPLAIGAWLGLMFWWSLRVRNKKETLYLPVLIVFITVTALGITNARQKDEVWRTRVDTSSPLQGNEWPRGDRSSGPVVVLAASGGGSRAAIFTAKTLAAIDGMPDIAANLQAISSVSGGSLANAAYVSRRLRQSGIIKDTAGSGCEASLSSAVSRDFIQPTIMGIWQRGGRGQAIQREWERCPVGLANVSIDTLARVWRESRARNESKAPFPIPLFNSTTLERNAVVISPLDQRFFASPFDAEARSKENRYRSLGSPTWVYYRSGIYHLTDLTGSMDAPLSAAVRASANFPFGFPLVEVEARRRLWYSTTMADTVSADTTARMVHLTDGGALSNSGMWPLVPLLVNQRDQVGDNRGVLMIVVDASRMPGAPWTDRQRGLMATLLDKNPKGERLHLQMLEQLQAEYGNCFGYVYIGIEPKPKYNVYTTWALDRGSLQVVDSAFTSAWSMAGPRVKEEYARLQTCENSRDPRVPKRLKLLPSRVPLS